MAITEATIPDFGVVESGTTPSLDTTAGGTLTTDGTWATSSGSTAADYGVFSFDQSSGTWTYTLNQAAADSLADGEIKHDFFTITDSDGNSYPIDVTITGANDAPVLNVISLASYNDTPFDNSFSAQSGTISSNDVDAGDTASYSIVGGGASGDPSYTDQLVGTYGTLYLNATDGHYRYVPNDAAIEALKAGATDSFDIRVTDALGATDTQTFTVSLIGTDDIPAVTLPTLSFNDTAVDDSFAAVGGVFAASDREGDTLSFNATGAIASSTYINYDLETDTGYGTLYLGSTTGQWFFVPNAAALQQFTGDQTVFVTIQVSDGFSTVNQGLEIDIHGGQDTPTFTVAPGADTSVVEAGAGVAGDANAGGTVTVADRDAADVGFQTPSSLNGVYGTFTFDVSTGAWTYALNNGQANVQALKATDHVTDTLTVNSADGTAYAITVNIDGSNDAPVVSAIPGATYTDTPANDSFVALTGTVAATDAEGEALTYDFIGSGVDTSLTGYDRAATVSTLGTFYLNSTTGAYTFIPDNAGIQAETGNSGAGLIIQVTDASGATTNRTLNITFTGDNDVADVGGQVAGNVTEDAAATLHASGVATVVDRDTNESSFQPASGSTAHGSYTVDAAGNWTFDADNSQTAIQQLAAGATLTDTFTIHSQDNSASEVVTVTITGVNDVPTIGGQASASVAEDSAATLTGSGNLTIADADLAQSSFQAQTHVGTYGTFTLGTGGHWDYAANNSLSAIQALGAGESLTDSFTAVSADGSATQQVSVHITGTNDLPVANDDTGSTNDGDPVQLDVLANDSDTDLHDTLTVQAAHVVSGGGTVSVASDGSSITFDPGSDYAYLASGESAVVTISYTVADGHGGTATAQAEVVVLGGNAVPVILPATEAVASVTELGDQSANENHFTHGVSGTIYFSDSDTADHHTTSFVAQGGNYLGHFSLGAVSDASGTAGWSFTVDDSDLNHLAQGEVVRQFYTVTVSDGQGGTVDQVVEVDLVGTNDAAHVSAANVVVPQESGAATASGQLTVTDEDGPAQFAAQTGTAGQYGHLTVGTDGHWSFVANQAYNLAPNQYLTDVFTVLAADGTPTTVAVTISGVDHPAVAQQDLFVTNEATAIGAGLSLFADNGHGVDADPDGGTLVVSAVNGSTTAVGHTIQLASGALLTVNANGTFSYDPNHAFDSLTNAPGAANSFAFDSFSYTLAGGTTATAFVDVTGLASPEDVLVGSGIDNAVTGFATDDIFLMNQAGHDSANGLGGDDGIYFGAYFDSQDRVDGGAGRDTLALQGNTTANLGGVSNIEVLLAMSGTDTQLGDTANNRYSYDLTTADGTIGAGQTLTVIGIGLQGSENLHFDGSAETDGDIVIYTGQGVDDLKGGAGSDGFFFGANGNLTGADHVDGGAGIDTLALRGNYVGGQAVTFQDGSFTNVEVLAFLSGHTNEYSGVIVPNGYDYDVTMADGNVAAGQLLSVIAAGLRADETVRFDGRAETDGAFRILSGAGDDTIWGGAKGDTLYGGLGADRLEGGAGADVYFYRSAAESTSTHYDTIVGFDYREDRIDLPGGGARAFTQAGSGNLSTSSFDADLAAGLNGVLGSGQAALFTATGGSLAGHVFAVVDANGVAGYQAGEDFVIEMASPVVPIDPHATVIA